jgi:carbamoyl-phosphate synthase small subunit
MQPTRLVMADGKEFRGSSPTWQQVNYSGEVVFNTGMTGYVESLTDPSYAGQILVFTYPLIGNYGVSPTDTWESSRIHTAGVIVSEACVGWSHAGSQMSLLDWLHEQEVPIITDIDTRALTKHLRKHGTMPGVITTSNRSTLVPAKVPKVKVTIPEPLTYNNQCKKLVILVDCGAKNNILRSLINLPIKVKRVPADYDYTNEKYDGVVISNGPGDPVDYPKTVAILKKSLALNKPVFGICLGNQVLGLAAGGKTYKLLYGHRGHNQPCIQSDKHCFVTSQNHGYAIDEWSLSKNWRISFRNLNDNSVEGIEHITKPFFSVQFHPEASPGPTDTAWLFQKFYNSLG